MAADQCTDDRPDQCQHDWHYSQHHGDHEHIKQIKRIYKDWRKRIQIRHRRVNRRLRKEKIPAYTNNQEQYDHIRGMIATGRIRPMLANLLDDEGLTGIGEASKKMNVPIRKKPDIVLRMRAPGASW